MCGWSWRLQNEALIHVSYEIVIHLLMLSMVLLDMRAPCLVSSHGSGEGHTRRYILTLVNHVTLQPLVLHGLVQNLLHIHGAAHLLFLVNLIISLSFVSLSIVLRHFV